MLFAVLFSCVPSPLGTSENRPSGTDEDPVATEELDDANPTEEPTADEPPEPDEPEPDEPEPDEPSEPPATDTGLPGVVVDCSALTAAGHDVCQTTADTCEVVFYDGSGCQAACASAGLECVDSYRDDDSGTPQCAIHQPVESFACANTGHNSDYCVCAAPAAPPPPPPPPVPGQTTCMSDSPTYAGTVDISTTIVIDEPGVYDYGNVLHRWTGSGSCNQTENQPYILRIAASDVTVRNFAYEDAPDGIHIGTANDGQGHSSGDYITNITLENITGTACEDALTIQYGVDEVVIRDSLFLPNPNASYRDKLFQLNFGNVRIEGSTFYGGDSSTCLMYKGGQDVEIVDSCFIDCDRATNGSTIEAPIGLISNDPSTLYSENNIGENEDRAWMVWDPYIFHHGDGDVTVTSMYDDVRDNGIFRMQNGAVLNQTP